MDVMNSVLAGFSGLPMVPLQSDRVAVHVGQDDLPFMPAGAGGELKLVHVDLNQGLWISITRFEPGTRIARHFHTGCVLAVTLSGSWYYEEYPQSVNQRGSYLFEPAGSVHTLVCPDDAELTEVWFAIWGANVLMDEDGNATAIVDAHRSLALYRAYAEAIGTDLSALIVVGD